MKDDIYIFLLKEARKELNDTPHGINLDQFKARVNPYGLQIDRLRLFSDIYNNGHAPIKERTYHMCYEAYMKLLEYEDLQQARNDSKNAQRWSIVATLLAFAAIVLQIIYGQCQG